jgi:membrane-associated phospholipid phosphatase
VDRGEPARQDWSGGTRAWRKHAVVTFVASAAVFVLLAWSAAAEAGPARVDPFVQNFVVDHRVGWLTEFLRVATFLGSTLVLGAVLAGFAAFLWATRRDVTGPAVPVAAFLLAILAKNAGKALIERPRPSPLEAIGSNTGFAFPSGHAADSLAVFALIALIASTGRSPRVRWAIWSGAALVILVVGGSRVYLGSHWLTDVVGGWALAAAIVSLLASAILDPGRRRRPAGRVTSPEEPTRT